MSAIAAPVIATTGRKATEEAVSHAKWAAERLGVPYLERGTLSLPELRERTGALWVLVARSGVLTLDHPDGEFFFHPNMAHLRLKNLRFGGERRDHMVEAMDLCAGMDVLDCTLGLGADAIVESFVVGGSGSVTALEASPLIETVVGFGLRHFVAENWPIQEAMRRVVTQRAAALDFLREAETDRYDVVYFDPMFRHPLEASKSLDPLRLLADPRPLDPETVAEACRVARERVVLKETAHSDEFRRLGFTKIYGGRYSKVHYGVIYTGKGEDLDRSR